MADSSPRKSPAIPDPERGVDTGPPKPEGDERRKALLQVSVPVILLAAVAFGYTFTKLEPPAPRELVIAAGDAGGAYYPIAESYAASLEQHGFTLEVRETAGSVENLRLLEAGEVDLALVQGGVADEQTHDGLESLGSVFLEPVWLFHRSGLTLESFSDLEGLRVATGAEGSGTRSLVAALLEVAGLTGRLEEQSTPSAEAVRALRAGELDAAFLVASVGASYIRELLADPGVALFSVRRDRAFQVRFPFLSRVVLGEGVVDIDDNLPPRDISLLAAAAMVVARKDLHHALIPVLVEAMSGTHDKGGIFEEAGFFPSVQLVDLPLKTEAAHYIENGPGFLYRILPYRTAAAVDRLAILLLPFIPILLVVFRMAPPLYRWRIRSKIFRWYDDLRQLDLLVLSRPSDDRIVDALETLDRLEREVLEVQVPLSYMDEFYNLRVHIELIEKKLREVAPKGESDGV